MSPLQGGVALDSTLRLQIITTWSYLPQCHVLGVDASISIVLLAVDGVDFDVDVVTVLLRVNVRAHGRSGVST